MSRLQQITSALASVNETVFQELCDSYLVLRNKNYSAFSRVGSHSFKQKTTIGTPDSLILLPNGKYIFIEYSTNKTKGLKKIKEDIEKCIDTKKTGIDTNEISEIIVCINFNLNGKQIEELRAKLKQTRILLTIVMLDDLALQLNLNHRDLSHRYLGLTLDTGQIVSIDTFISEYNKSAHGVATPLNNTFCHREQELFELNQSLNQTDFIILTGPAGVGKTRLALESVRSFLKNNSDFRAYCVSYKNYSLLYDLYHYIQKDENCILVIDDANRIDALNQVFGFYRSFRTGKLKILLTVRDYAFEDVRNLAYDFNPTRIEVLKFNDDQITDIIKAKPYEILNPEYQKEIIRIADGNPRLAIMASLLAKVHQNLYILSDVSNLFDSYFTTLIKDNVEFSNKGNLKFLGLIAFFYTIPYKDKALVESILFRFNLQYNDFIDSISKLEQLELVELQYEHVKISEQNLSTYFFYRCFIKDKLLSFQTLLVDFFDSNTSRFKDTVIAANNTFGPNNVMKELKPNLVIFFNQASTNSKEKILETFWFYLQEETLSFIYNEVVKLSKPEKPEFVLKEDNNRNYLDSKDKILGLLSNFFWSVKLKDTLGLLFAYIEKTPSQYSTFIRMIKEQLIFDREDEHVNYERQVMLFNELILGLNNGNELLTLSFYEIAGYFMGYQFRHTKGGRKHTILLYEYKLEPLSIITEFRNRIWYEIDNQFEKFPELSLRFLNTFISPGTDINLDIFKQDLSKLMAIVKKHLTPRNYHHCVFVNKLKNVVLENSVDTEYLEPLRDLSKKFTNDIYKLSEKLSWDRFRNKESYEYESHEEFEKLKEKEIRYSFRFQSIEKAKNFFTSYTFLHKAVAENWGFNKGLDLIIDENYSINPEIGSTLLEQVIQNNNEIGYVPRVLFKNNLNSIDKKHQLWGIIQAKDFQHHEQWEISFFQFLDESLIDKSDCSLLLTAYRDAEESLTIFFDNLIKYEKFNPSFFKNFLGIIEQKNAKSEFKLKIWHTDFAKYFNSLGSNFDLIFNVFIQQEISNQHYDYNGEILRKFLEKDKAYLLKYLKAILDENKRLRNNSPRLNFVWEIINIEPTIAQAMDYLIDNSTFYGILEHTANSFFYNLKEKEGSRADAFLLKYLEENNTDFRKVNAVIDIVRHSRKNLFRKCLLTFIALNQDVSIFSKIWWRGNGGSYSGKVIIGDIEAADWRNILSIVETSEIGIELLPIKKYINSQIEGSLESADYERKRRFLDRDEY